MFSPFAETGDYMHIFDLGCRGLSKRLVSVESVRLAVVYMTPLCFSGGLVLLAQPNQHFVLRLEVIRVSRLDVILA